MMGKDFVEMPMRGGGNGQRLECTGIPVTEG